MLHGISHVGDERDHQMQLIEKREELSEIDHIPDFARDLHLNTIQILGLVPLPGTEVYDQLNSEGRIFNKDWSDYDGHHPVFKPQPFEMMDKVITAMKNFYSSTDHIMVSDWKSSMINKTIYYFARGMIKGWAKDFKKYVKKWKDYV